MTTTFVEPLPIVLCQTISPPRRLRLLPLPADWLGNICKVYRRFRGRPTRHAESIGCARLSSTPLKIASDAGRRLRFGCRRQDVPACRYPVDPCGHTDIGHEL